MVPTEVKGRKGRRWPLLLLIGGALVALVVVAAALAGRRNPASPSPPPAPTINTDVGQRDRAPLVFTYFFYWYDAQTLAHLEPQSGLPVHLPPDPPPSWRSVEWFRKQLSDMAYAGIDVVLPVYWGTGEQWSIDGLPYLAEAKRQLKAELQAAPNVGLFFDTTILGGRDLTQAVGKEFFYENIRQFFGRIPSEQWALIDGRPIIWLYFSFFASAFDQTTFDYIYDSFQRDFGVRPYIVREVSWDFTVVDRGGRQIDESRPIATEANYKWGAALESYFERGSVAAVGPGFDEREIPGRGDAFRPRGDGQWYIENFQKATASGKRMLVIETWNEIHEASGVSETVEFGRTYLDLTRQLVEAYKGSLHSPGP